MTITYSTNWMGPINYDWIEKHGIGWSAGRIDIYGTESHYPEEISLPPMRSEDWNRFSNWLDEFSTETPWTFDELVSEYEKYYPKINFLNKDEIDGN